MSGRAVGAGRRAAAVATAGAVVVGVTWYAMSGGSDSGSTSATPVAIGSAEVTRGTVTEQIRVGGVLGYEGSYPVLHQGEPGVVTAAAQPGATVERGGVLYAVANQRVRLLYGATPAYRGFAAGMPAGPDVRQLEENLVALGLDPQHRITVDERFSASTATAIRRWQASWGVPVAQRTGSLPPGQVVFLPGAVRVAEIRAVSGGAVEPNQPVLAATSTNRVVTVALGTDRQGLVRRDDAVTVSVTGQPAFPGRVTDVGAVAVAAPVTAAAAQSGGGREAQLTVRVTIAVTVPDTARSLDQAPVQVAITRQVHRGVLLVPVTALLAGPGGGYRVRLTAGQLVDVALGLSDEATGLVEVTGDLAPGVRVEVPAT